MGDQRNVPAGMDDRRGFRRPAEVARVDRIQLERLSKHLFPSIREYHLLYGITEQRLKVAKKDVIVMHPGPMNRGVEISQEVADGPHSVITEQVTNGVAVRMAVLYLLSGGQQMHKEPVE